MYMHAMLNAFDLIILTTMAPSDTDHGIIITAIGERLAG